MIFILNTLPKQKTMTKKESRIILNEIYKTEELHHELDKYIVIKLNYEKDKYRKPFEFMSIYEEDMRSIESTYNINTLDEVMKELFNDYVINFECEIF